jgi:molybdopterin converting factor subunit 1
MYIKVRLFAAFKDLLGESELDINLEEGSTIDDVKEYLKSNYPQINHLINISRFAVNMEYKSTNEKLSDGDELSIIMPVSGGAIYIVN